MAHGEKERCLRGDEVVTWAREGWDDKLPPEKVRELGGERREGEGLEQGDEGRTGANTCKGQHRVD